MSRYYIADGMVQRGPFEVQDLPGQGVRADTLVWKEGMAQWRRADEVEELIFSNVLRGVAVPQGLPPVPVAAPTPGVPMATPYNPVPAPTSTNRIVAGVCGIVLGTFGVHKFVAGLIGPGIVMLLVGLVGGILTCGIASIVTQVIGIIEGIIYLTRTDEQFHQEYVVGRKGWF